MFVTLISSSETPQLLHIHPSDCPSWDSDLQNVSSAPEFAAVNNLMVMRPMVSGATLSPRYRHQPQPSRALCIGDTT
ncbi:hypothetical protein AV530_013063 [Patagioenas fasciata monilis]|uniref:Uncharacterized protein n=1 Tax=Patagioenas fasciata monilis TaxID=372326 RepID=A0A1V4JB93_PATFA|nr:hypothetical protein AV530_013063 [Patagioenas fasciata monilis]